MNERAKKKETKKLTFCSNDWSCKSSAGLTVLNEMTIKLSIYQKVRKEKLREQREKEAKKKEIKRESHTFCLSRIKFSM
jgi:hypothetical protein